MTPLTPNLDRFKEPNEQDQPDEETKIRMLEEAEERREEERWHRERGL